ncbi:MAG: M48 family metallopeptidase, partial [Bacteroidota bacterium]
MASRKKASIYSDRKFEITPDRFIPLRIYQELRNGYRATVGKQHLIFRLPHGLNPMEQQKCLDALSDWARKTFKQRPDAFQHLLPAVLKDEGQIRVMDQIYRVSIQETEQLTSHLGVFVPDETERAVHLTLSKKADQYNRTKAVQKLLSRLFSQKYLPTITERVHELNALFFQQPIEAVRLRLTQSRWGSCSSTGNINLSSRLLLVPAEVRDSVIIHELAHRIEMNHSHRFWKLVYDAMPNYEIHHKYLDEND